MTDKLAIIGSADLGQLIAYHSSNCKLYNVTGFYDDFAHAGTSVGGYKVLGKIENIESDYKAGKFDCLMVAIGYKHMAFRKKVFEKFFGKIPFGTIIHTSAYVDTSCKIGQGCFILPGCVLDRNVSLDNNVLLNTGCVIAHDTIVHSHSFLSPAVKIAGFTTVNECCVIGINATIIDNINITAHTNIGAGAVVIDNIVEPGLYVGCPAKKIK